LGMEVERNHDERLLCMNQIKYLKEILKRFWIEECKLIRVPFDPKMKLQKNANGITHVYVDDLILVCNNQNKLLQIKEELN
jgi:hypothetical protein